MADALVPIVVYSAAVGLAVLALKWPGVAVVASLAAFVGGAVTAAALGYDGPGRFPWIIFAATAVVVILSRGQPDAGGWPYAFAKWTLILAAAPLAIAFWMEMGAVPAGIWHLLLLAAVLRFVVLSRKAVAQYVVSTVSACMRQHVPLASGLAAAAFGRSDKRAIILRRVGSLLARGLPLSEALRFGYRACPGDVLATVVAAERMDQVPAAFQRLEADLDDRARRTRQVRPCPYWYPLLVLLIAWGIVSGILVWILPAFAKILEEVDQPLPAATTTVVNVASFVRGLPPLVSLGILIGVPVGIYAMFRPRRADRTQPLAWLGDVVKWHLPFGRWFERNRSLLAAVEVLRFSLAAGRGLDDAIEATLGLDVNCCYRSRLRRWLRRVRRGDDVAEAARAAGLGRSLAWALDRRVNPNNAPRALETLETICRSRYTYRLRLLRYVSWPLVVIALGALVGYVAYAFFLMIVEVQRATMAAIP